MYGAMEQVSPNNTEDTAGRGLCLPYAVSALFPGVAAFREILRTGSGPYTMESIGGEVAMRFSIYGEEVVSAGEYLLLLESGGRTHCVGLSVENNNVCTWYGAERDFVMRFPLDLLPRPESIDLALVTSSESGLYIAHTRPSAKTPLGGRRPKADPDSIDGGTSNKRNLSDEEREDISFGGRIESPGQSGRDKNPLLEESDR